MVKKGKKKILIVSGESSGERNAAQLITELKKQMNVEVFAVGGAECKKAGATVLYDIKDLSIVGFNEAIKKLPSVLKLRKKLFKFVKSEKIDLLIPVDFPDFNFSLLPKMKKLGLKIIYFISPQIWAWRRGRIKKIKKYVDRMLVLLPFEKTMYDQAGVDAVYVGNTAVERVKVSKSKESFRKEHKIPINQKVITILPGSRTHEIDDILPTLLESLKLLDEHGKFSYIISPATSVYMDGLEKMIEETSIKNRVVILPGEAWNAAAASDVVITKSGTSTIEMALIGTPFLVVYKTSAFAYKVARTFYKNKSVSLVNIIGDDDVVEELIQDEFTPKNVSDGVMRLIKDKEMRSRITSFLKDVKKRMGKSGASKRAAEAVVELIK